MDETDRLITREGSAQVATDLLSYPPLRRKDPFHAPEATQPHPVAGRLGRIYARSGFPRLPEGQAVIAAALRGSTAVYCRDDRLAFRHPRSDIDVVAIVAGTTMKRPRYRFYYISDRVNGERELDILCLTPSNLRAEARGRYHTFLSSKLVQPCIPFISVDIYEDLVVETAASLIRRGLVHRAVRRLTPSGAARLVIEEDLFAEPWRWQSLRTYYVTSPSAAYQRARLTLFCGRALERLADLGVVHEITTRYGAPAEPVYRAQFDLIGSADGATFRPRAIATFVIDQFRTLLRSGGKSFAPAQAMRLLMKAASLRANPRLRDDADIVFGR